MLSTVLLSHTPVLLSCSHYMPCSLDVIKVLYYQPSQAQRYECIMGVTEVVVWVNIAMTDDQGISIGRPP